MMFGRKWVADQLSTHPTGSRYICHPPVTDTDEDHVVLVPNIEVAAIRLERDGWTVNRDDPAYQYGENNEVEFITARKGHLNLIIYDDHRGYSAFLAATEVAQILNLTDKEHRVALFKAVCGNRGRR
ncbi:hypothetical protein V6R85_02445 [Agrobacterium sp. CCNWLW32]|uniref:hypothetical protein n=1 Tax=Agrobacterium sp. CCNWLW32 TaxID=3122072 RepID=UPI00300FAB39